jgi:hypothetical protein
LFACGRYAHNILVGDSRQLMLNASTSVKLSDFGAAFYYGSPPEMRARAAALQAMEMRAYGLLLEELIEHTGMNTSGDHGGGSADTTVLTATMEMRATVRDLAARALLPVMAQRPTFAQALQQLGDVCATP